MTNEQVKEKLSISKEFYKWLLTAILVTTAGTISMFINSLDKGELAYKIFAFVGLITVVFQGLYAKKIILDMDGLIKELK